MAERDNASCKSRREPTAHQKIIRAYEAGRGIDLSYADVAELARDQAIITRAKSDDAGDKE